MGNSTRNRLVLFVKSDSFGTISTLKSKTKKIAVIFRLTHNLSVLEKLNSVSLFLETHKIFLQSVCHVFWIDLYLLSALEAILWSFRTSKYAQKTLLANYFETYSSPWAGTAWMKAAVTGTTGDAMDGLGLGKDCGPFQSYAAIFCPKNQYTPILRSHSCTTFPVEFFISEKNVTNLHPIKIRNIFFKSRRLTPSRYGYAKVRVFSKMKLRGN